MKRTITFTVIIVTCNRLNLLKECLECVENQTAKVTRIVVIDNFSTDGTKEYLEQEKNTDNRYLIIHESENTGGAGGFSKGVEIAEGLDGDWILLIDDDAMLNSRYLEEIEEAIKKYPACQAFSGRVETEGIIDLMHRRRKKKRDSIAMENVQASEYKKECFPLDAASFCGIVIEKKLIRKIGLPEKDFFIWNDDLEYSLRIREHSDIYNINSAFLNHKTNLLKERKSKKYLWKDYYGFRNYYYTCMKYGYKKDFIKSYYKERMRLLYWRLKSKVTKEEYKYNLTLLLRAKNDAVNKKLGISEIYYPGR